MTFPRSISSTRAVSGGPMTIWTVERSAEDTYTTVYHETHNILDVIIRHHSPIEGPHAVEVGVAPLDE